MPVNSDRPHDQTSNLLSREHVPILGEGELAVGIGPITITLLLESDFEITD